MSTLLQPAVFHLASIDHRLAASAHARASRRVRLLKLLSMALLTICFWYSVPYHLPIDRPTDLAAAAASASAQSEGSLARQIAVPLIALIAAWMLWRLPRRGRFRGKLMLAGIAYLAWATLSLTWSQVPLTTAKRLVVFAVDVFFALTAAQVFSVFELALWGFTATSIVALISLYADVVIDRVFAPFDPTYRFMGVMEANYQAMNLVACILCALTLLDRKPRWSIWLAPSTLCAFVLLFLTRSRVSTFLCVAMIAVFAIRFARARLPVHQRALTLLAALVLTVPAAIFIFGSQGRSAVTSAFMMGRSDTENTATLSNRAPLWSELSESFARHPFLGHGYQAFWTPDRVEAITFDQGWPVPNAHNTYLDQALSLGLPGAALYLGLLWGACLLAWQRYRRTRSAEALLPALLLIWIALESLAESVPLDPYLPTLLAYICLVKMCLVEHSEALSDTLRAPTEILTGLPAPALGPQP